jgi:hypothetical protein
MIVNGFGNETIVNSHIPIDKIRRRKEQLKREIQVDLFYYLLI